MDSLVSLRSINNTKELSTSCQMIHYMPSIESLDPRIREIYKGMRTPNAPRYGLGYIEQCDTVIPEC